METVQLNKVTIVSVVAQYWASLEFPREIYISLEDCVGVPEGSGGVGCGDVVNTLHDMEEGLFYRMARIDELLLNIPSKAEAAEALEKLRASRGSPENPWEVDHAYWSGHPWKFATEVNGTAIDWK
ncbi:MAG: hypothetical protein HZB55_00550 [Deltaproteobacteria bacterium]|nr:hypothetical protein [Deltaproteobacteria bacterium]